MRKINRCWVYTESIIGLKTWGGALAAKCGPRGWGMERMGAQEMQYVFHFQILVNQLPSDSTCYLNHESAKNQFHRLAKDSMVYGLQ